MHDGQGEVFFALGGNFLSAAPDTERTAEALRRCRLTVHVSTKLNRGHLVTGDEALILPCLGRTELDVQAGARAVRHGRGLDGRRARVAGQARAGEPAPAQRARASSRGSRRRRSAAAAAAHRLGAPWPTTTTASASTSRAWSRAARTTTARVTVPGGFRLPQRGARARLRDPDAARRTSRCTPCPRTTSRPGQLLMMTIRSHDQYNTTIYGLDDRYRGIARRAARRPHERARPARARPWRTGDAVDITSHFVDGERVGAALRRRAVRHPARLLRHLLPGEANVLVPLGAVARKSNTPASKSVVVSVNRFRPEKAPRERHPRVSASARRRGHAPCPLSAAERRFGG